MSRGGWRGAPSDYLWVVAALTVLGGVLRFATLDVQSFWLDEAVTVEVVRSSLGGVLDRVVETESTPHVYYLLAWAWGNVFGVGEIGLRSLSALLGTATIPLVYFAGARLVDRPTGLAAAAVVAVNPMAIHYSQEARAYALLILVSAVTLVGFALLYEEDDRPRRGPLLFWAAGCCVALASHYFAVFLIAAEAAVLLWQRPRLRRQVAVALTPIVATGLLLLPVALDQRSHGFADWITEDSLVTRVVQVVKQFLVGVDGPAEKATTALAGLLLLAGLVLLAWRGDRSRVRRAAVAAAVGIIALLLPLLAALAGTDYFNARNVIAALVPFVVVAGAGWAVSSRLGIALLAAYAVLSLAILGVVQTEVRYQRDDWRSAAADLGKSDHARAIVVSPYDGRIPLSLYRPLTAELSSRDLAKVEEIAYVGMGEKTPGAGASAPIAISVEPPLPGFRLVEQRDAATYTILRFRSDEPREVTPAIAARPRFEPSGERQGVLLEPVSIDVP